MEKITLSLIKKEIKRMDSKLSPKEDAYKSALILLAALAVGPSADKVAKFTNLPIAFVRIREKRLRRNKVWFKNKTQAEWFEKDGGGIAFWLDVLVAEGMMKRT